jgi:hypothetical protein
VALADSEGATSATEQLTIAVTAGEQWLCIFLIARMSAY